MMSTKKIAIAFSLAAHLSSAFQPRVLSSFAAASVTRHSSSSSISMDSGLTLYGSQQTRSPLVNWYLEEKSIPFTQKAPRPSTHPFGQTPFLTDDGGVEVFESGAILLYIADAYGGKWVTKRHSRLLSTTFPWRLPILKPWQSGNLILCILRHENHSVILSQTDLSQ